MDLRLKENTKKITLLCKEKSCQDRSLHVKEIIDEPPPVPTPTPSSIDEMEYELQVVNNIQASETDVHGHIKAPRVESLEQEEKHLGEETSTPGKKQ